MKSSASSTQTSPSPTDTTPREYDLPKARDLLGIGRKRLIKWSKDGRLPHTRDGMNFTFQHKDLIHFALTRCLQCGELHTTISTGIYFCTHCASSFSTDTKHVELDVMCSDMERTRQQMFMMRLQDKQVSDEEAVDALTERYQISRLLAYQRWFRFFHQKEGTHIMGFGEGAQEDE